MAESDFSELSANVTSISEKLIRPSDRQYRLTKEGEQMPISDLEKSKQSEKNHGGRKPIELKRYSEESETKVNNWKKMLAAGFWDNGAPLTKKDRTSLRNRISAQMLRTQRKC